MAKPIKLYWDSCAWLGFLNGEDDKKRELEIVYGNARNGKYELWTSTFSMVEARRLKVEEQEAKPLSDANLKKIKDIFGQPFVNIPQMHVFPDTVGKAQYPGYVKIGGIKISGTPIRITMDQQAEAKNFQQ